MNRLMITAAITSIAASLSACGGSSKNTVAAEPIQCSSAQALRLEEGIVGDTSNDPLNPTPWILGAGANVFIASTLDPDDDYITFNVGTCDTLDSITLTNYTSISDDATFMAIQRGTSFTVRPETAASRPGELLGYTTYNRSSLNQDVLALASQGNGAIGFTAPLPAGDYTILFDQAGDESQFTLVFNVSRVEP